MNKDLVERGARWCALFCATLGTVLTTVVCYAEEAVAPLHDSLTFSELLKAGGWVAVSIGVMSVVTLTLAIIAFVVVRKRNYIPADVLHSIADLVNHGKFKDALTFCREESDVPLCRIIEPGLRKAEMHAEEKATFEPAEFGVMIDSIKKVIEAAGVREFDRLRSFVIWFNNIGVISPMLGLLGTVVGMIQAFGAIAYKVETGKPALLGLAISKAMVNTAGGLLVGVAAMFLYYYFASKTTIIATTVEEVSEDLIEGIEHQLRKKRKK